MLQENHHTTPGSRTQKDLRTQDLGQPTLTLALCMHFWRQLALSQEHQEAKKHLDKGIPLIQKLCQKLQGVAGSKLWHQSVMFHVQKNHGFNILDSSAVQRYCLLFCPWPCQSVEILDKCLLGRSRIPYLRNVRYGSPTNTWSWANALNICSPWQMSSWKLNDWKAKVPRWPSCACESGKMMFFLFGRSIGVWWCWAMTFFLRNVSFGWVPFWRPRHLEERRPAEGLGPLHRNSSPAKQFWFFKAQIWDDFLSWLKGFNFQLMFFWDFGVERCWNTWFQLMFWNSSKHHTENGSEEAVRRSGEAVAENSRRGEPLLYGLVNIVLFKHFRAVSLNTFLHHIFQFFLQVIGSFQENTPKFKQVREALNRCLIRSAQGWCSLLRGWCSVPQSFSKLKGSKFLKVFSSRNPGTFEDSPTWLRSSKMTWRSGRKRTCWCLFKVIWFIFPLYKPS